jgi:hypothetical protein
MRLIYLLGALAFFNNANAVVVVPTLNSISATGATVKFTATLNSPLITGYSVKIDYGNGLKDMTCSANTCTLSSNTFTSNSNVNYSIGIYNNNVLQNTVVSSNYTLTTSVDAPVITPAANLTTGYTKVANDGSLLPDSAILGTGPKDWACTKDNKTGLIWEIKTMDGKRSLRDVNYGYTNYTSKYNPNRMLADPTNAEGFALAVNSSVNGKLCGKDNWRLPTAKELDGLISCKDGKYTPMVFSKNTTLNLNGCVTVADTKSPTFGLPWGNAAIGYKYESDLSLDPIYFPDTKSAYRGTNQRQYLTKPGVKKGVFSSTIDAGKPSSQNGFYSYWTSTPSNEDNRLISISVDFLKGSPSISDPNYLSAVRLVSGK